MARGKHRKRAQKRDTTRAQAEEMALQARIEEERRQLAALGELETELDYLTTEALQLRETLASRASEETLRLRAEIGELLREIVQLGEQERREHRHRDRYFLRQAGDLENDVEGVEKLLREVRGKDAVFTVGVHVKPGMSAEAVKRIQKARGLRKRGSR